MFQYIYQSARQYNFTVNQGEPTKIFLSWSPVNKSLNMMSLFGLFSWWIREGVKKWFLSLWGLTLPPLESDKDIFCFFWIIDHYLTFEFFLKKNV